MEAEETTYAPKQSLFNSTISQLMRINDLWILAHNHSRAGLLKAWNVDLDRIFCELSEDAKPNDFAAFENFYKRISKIYSQSNQLYFVLLEKEFFLRKLQNKQGKGTAYKESEESYMSD